MDFSFLSHINYLAVLVSSLIFFFFGSLWFSALFCSLWKQELERHNVVIDQSKKALYTKMALTMIANMLASFALACLVVMTHSTTLGSGLILGVLVALGFAATALSNVFVWEDRSLRLFLIDAGYPVFGIIMAAIVLSVWR